MKKPDDLRDRIEDSARSLSENYETTLNTISELKDKMLQLEQRISQKKPEEASQDTHLLTVAVDSLDRLTDLQILKSKAAWKKYEEFKHDCKADGVEPPQLDEFQKLCKKTEQLAADLLCYSLGLLKHENP